MTPHHLAGSVAMMEKINVPAVTAATSARMPKMIHNLAVTAMGTPKPARLSCPIAKTGRNAVTGARMAKPIHNPAVTVMEIRNPDPP